MDHGGEEERVRGGFRVWRGMISGSWSDIVHLQEAVQVLFARGSTSWTLQFSVHPILKSLSSSRHLVPLLVQVSSPCGGRQVPRIGTAKTGPGTRARIGSRQPSTGPGARPWPTNARMGAVRAVRPLSRRRQFAAPRASSGHRESAPRKVSGRLMEPLQGTRRVETGRSGLVSWSTASRRQEKNRQKFDLPPGWPPGPWHDDDGGKGPSRGEKKHAAFSGWRHEAPRIPCKTHDHSHKTWSPWCLILVVLTQKSLSAFGTRPTQSWRKHFVASVAV